MNISNFIGKIELSENVLEHLKETEEKLNCYIDRLKELPPDSRDIFLFDAMVKENIASGKLENVLYSPEVYRYCENKLQGNLTINKAMIVELNKCVLNSAEDIITDFRDEIVWVGCIDGKHDIEHARYIAPPPSEVPGLMDQFIEYYNSDFPQNEILKGAITHILFIKIHPFIDGNGRTARILHHHKLTEMINNKYQTDFQWPIINLSSWLDLTRGNYYQSENDIIFNEEADNSIAWDNWINYILNQTDDNIWYYMNRMDQVEYKFPKIEKTLKKMKKNI